jgi:hypothetical protein
MTLLDQYLRAVSVYLPTGPERDDILIELSEHLQSRLDERQASQGRPLTELEAAAVLAEHGDPLVVAGRYGRINQGFAFGRQLIGPELFPIYVRVLMLTFGLTVVIVPVISFFTDALRLSMPFGLIGPMLFQFVAVTLTFAGIDLFRLFQRRLCRGHSARDSRAPWRPAYLRPVPRAYAASGLVVLALAGLWWAVVPHVPVLLLGTYASGLGLELSAGWASFHLPILVLLLAGVAQRAIALARPELNWLQFGTRLVINVLCLVTLPGILGSHPLVVVSQATAGSADAMLLAAALSDWMWWIVLAGFGTYWLVNVVTNTWLSLQYTQYVRRRTRERNA